MPRATSDAKLLIQSLSKAYAATPTNLKIVDLYVVFAVATALIQVVYMGIVGSFPFNSFLSGVLSCIGTQCLLFASVFKSTKITRNLRIFPRKGLLQILFCAIWCSTW